MKGKIKFLNMKEGYGFIVSEDNKDIFYHISDFIDELNVSKINKGDDVEFEVGEGKKGKKAIKIKRI